MSDWLINPYSECGMIREPEKFFGRMRELREAYGRLATMQSISVIGERRIGKSSFLYRLAHPQNGDLPEQFTVQYLDLQRVFSVAEFYDRVCKLLGREAGESHLDLEAAIQDKQVVLCLDEFEQSYKLNFGDEFFNALRSYAQEGHLALVVATQAPLSQLHATYLEDQDVTSKFHNIFTRLRLDVLTEAEARALVVTPRDGQIFNEAETQHILKLAGNHPYWLNYVCAAVYDAKQNGAVDFVEIERKLNEERGLNQPAYQPALPQPESSSANLSAEPAAAAKPAEDPNVPVRWAIVLMLVGVALGSLSVNASFGLGVYLALAMLAGSLALLYRTFSWRGGV